MQFRISETLGTSGQSRALQKRPKGELITVAGEASPGAEYLQNKRTWKGLGSDFEATRLEDSTGISQGRSGIARGYVGEEVQSKT